MHYIAFVVCVGVDGIKNGNGTCVLKICGWGVGACHASGFENGNGTQK